MFRLKEKVVYPGHGVAYINDVIEKCVTGAATTFYELKFLHKDMTVLVPTHNAEVAGIRPLSSTETINEALKVLTQPARKIHHYEFTASNWNKRNKEYQAKLRTGNIRDLSEIYRDLCYIATQKELSFGEKNLLQHIEFLLVEEIALVRHLDEDQAIAELRSVFNHKPMPAATFSSRAL
jgi:CarD family transcriptional regulator